MTRRHRIWRQAERHILNPLMRSAIQRGKAPPSFALLETTGRRTGQLRHTPVGNGLDGDTFWLVAERGTDCAYVLNLMALPQVRVNIEGSWRTGTAHPLPEDDGFARRRRIDEANGRHGRFDGWIFTKSASTPMTIRIDLDPLPAEQQERRPAGEVASD